MNDRGDGNDEGQGVQQPPGSGRLRVLPGLTTQAGPSRVPLIRQLKLPDLARLTIDQQQSEALPGRLHAMQNAIHSGDLQAAEACLDEAVRPLLSGPGHQPESVPEPLRIVLGFRRTAWFVVLWLWLTIAVCLLGWYWMSSGSS